MASAPFEPGAANPKRSSAAAGTLSANIVAFCAWLRGHWQFLAGPGEAHDALRAAEIAGLESPSRLRRALRLVLCSKPEELKLFDDAFEAFFLHPHQGRPQPTYAPQHSRERSEPSGPQVQAKDRASGTDAQAGTEANASGAERGELVAANEATDSTDDWRTLLARYSSHAARADVPEVSASDVQRHLKSAAALVTSAHLGHVRRWRPQTSGHRFDVRRTLRASLHTGGDPVALRFLGHPLRNPRFVVLIDGSRSMAAYGSLMLEFAYALVQRSRRTHVFLFSTQLGEVTSQLRSGIRHSKHRISGVDEAWGGGTRIGESLSQFSVRFGARCLSDETVVIIYSDGFDVGNVDRLERAMHEIHRRSAGVIWVHPLAGTRGFAPEAKGMRASLPFIDALIGIRDAAELGGLAPAAHAISSGRSRGVARSR
jgi:uncharacterized protein with von Willebrand factor type A (vWA) domain